MTPSAVPSGEMPILVPEGSGETPIPMPPSALPSGEMPIIVPEGSGETPILMPPSLPSGEMPVLIPEGSGETPIPMPPSAVPSGEMPIPIPVGSGETPILLAPSGIPTGETPVSIPAEGSVIILEDETPILIGSISNGSIVQQSTLLVEESTSEEVLPGGSPGVPTLQTTSGVEITTTNDCCPEYTFKGSPDR